MKTFSYGSVARGLLSLKEKDSHKEVKNLHKSFFPFISSTPWWIVESEIIVDDRPDEPNKTKEKERKEEEKLKIIIMQKGFTHSRSSLSLSWTNVPFERPMTWRFP